MVESVSRATGRASSILEYSVRGRSLRAHDDAPEAHPTCGPDGGGSKGNGSMGSEPLTTFQDTEGKMEVNKNYFIVGAFFS